MVKVLVFAGSARRESLNKKLARVAAQCVERAGASATLVDLADYEMPLYNADLEAGSGIPENAQRLYKLFLEHSALLVACPEYNSSITPLLKNTIDWVSRPREGEPQLAAYRGKVAGLVSASPGALGGLRGLVTVRSILGNIGVLVVPSQAAISKAGDVFGDDGALKDEAQLKRVEAVAREVVEVAGKLGV